MRVFLWDGFFMGALETIVLHYLPLFAFAYGASNGEIGLLAASASMGAATASLPGAWLSTRWRYRKPFILITRGGMSHLFLLPLALVPLFMGEPLIFAAIIAAATARSFTLYMAEGAWTSLAADLVPVETRGRFFGARNFLIGLGGLAGIGAVALLLAGLGPDTGWSAVWFLTVGLGIVSSLFYSRIPEHELPEPAAVADERGGWWGVMKDARFRRYGLTVLIWNMSLYFAAPFFNVHLVKNLDASPLWVGGLLAVGAVFGLIGQGTMGRLVDARGARRLIVPCGLAVGTLPLMWFFVTAPWQVIFINAIGGVLWAGYLLATFAFLLAISPPGQQRYYAAAYTTLMFLSMTAGPLLGGALAAAYGIKAVFIASGVGRIGAVVLFAATVHETSAEPPNEAPSRRALPQVNAPAEAGAAGR